MAYSDKGKAYARQWYRKNKERLKSLPHRKEAKKISDRKYYLKNKARLKRKAKEYRQKNIERYKIKAKEYYEANREHFILLNREKRKTSAYKLYVKEYRKKNLNKINEQARLRGPIWMKKQIDSLSDNYILSRLINKKVGIFKTYAEARKHPEIIELTRSRILLSRIKRKIKDAADVL